MKKALIYTISLMFLISTAVIAGDVVEAKGKSHVKVKAIGKVIGVKEGKVLIKVGSKAKKFKKGDTVLIKKGSKEALMPKLQGC